METATPVDQLPADIRGKVYEVHDVERDGCCSVHVVSRALGESSRTLWETAGNVDMDPKPFARPNVDWPESQRETPSYRDLSESWKQVGATPHFLHRATGGRSIFTFDVSGKPDDSYTLQQLLEMVDYPSASTAAT